MYFLRKECIGFFRRFIMKDKIMKYKDKIMMFGGIVLAGALVVTAAANSGGLSGCLEEEAFRTAADVNNADVFYFDSEAVALSDMSNSDSGLRAEALEAYNQVNDKRAEAGLDSLAWDKNLETSSNVRAEECSVSFSHTRPSGKAWYTVDSKNQGGENLAFGFDTADDAVEAWMNSPTHRDNIEYPDFTRVAISIYRDDDGTCYWAQEFGY